ncbi:response regulator [bacterium]|nr:response regulator [bacterium]
MAKDYILIIDDEPKVRKVLEIQLKNLGYDILAASNAIEAYEALENNTLSVVICDIRLPKQRGDQILEYAVKRYPTLPVIMLTGLINVNLAVSVMKMGAFDYLTKPIKREDLAITIKKALEYRKLQEDKLRLEKQNIRYRKLLEKKVEERTSELRKALKQLQASYIDTVRSLSTTIEAKDPYIKGHSYRVSQYAILLAKEFDINSSELQNLEFGSLLHDIGKITIDNRILHKKEPLTKKEREIIQQHPLVGESIVKNIDFFRKIRPFIRNHHESYDGNGYPDKLKGDKISFTVRILTLVDAFDAMNSTRAYRNKMPIKKILEVLVSQRGKQFDPEIVDKFIESKIHKHKVILLE